jgi:hypothetical protein
MTPVFVRQDVGVKSGHLLWLELFTELPHMPRQLLANLVPQTIRYNRHRVEECPSAGGVTSPHEERWL